MHEEHTDTMEQLDSIARELRVFAQLAHGDVADDLEDAARSTDRAIKRVRGTYDPGGDE